jgi:enolase
LAITTDALDALMSAIEEAGYTESDITIGLMLQHLSLDGEAYSIDGKLLDAGNSLISISS